VPRNDACLAHNRAANHHGGMLDIFVSYTANDRAWADWIGHELEALGHRPHLHDWEISGGEDIAAWMEKRHHDADRILCVVSKTYLDKPYSSWERRSGQWAAMTNRPGFVLPVLIEPCEMPTLFAPLKNCELYGINEEAARSRLREFVMPAVKPTKRGTFPGSLVAPPSESAKAPPKFPSMHALSNIPISVPRHFVGRDDALAAIERALARGDGRAAITALHGLRGVGKTVLAAAYADRHRGDYRATWWIRAQTSDGMRADLVALGVRLGWVGADDKEQPAFESVMERLRDEGGRILLIYDNATNADELRSYLPLRGASRVLITSNAPVWRAIAEPVEIRVWPKDTGADYLIARTGRTDDRADAMVLSETLGGLPLAHEQAAAYCERLEVPLAEYHRRFEATPERLLDDAHDAPREYHDRTTVAKTFALAIEEATKVHPAAESLVVYAAQLAAEPIPLFFFSEGRENFDEPLASTIADEGLDEVVAALRTFALLDRETIADERDPTITTHCIRLHRLVRQVAQGRVKGEARKTAFRALTGAMVAVYPVDVFDDPATWPRARRLDEIALGLVAETEPSGPGGSNLLFRMGKFRHKALTDYARAASLFERSLSLCESIDGEEHLSTAARLYHLAVVAQAQGDFAEARRLAERDLAISQKLLGSEHRDTASSLNSLGSILYEQGEFREARSLYERTLAICEKVLGPEHPDTARTLNNLAGVLYSQGESTRASALYKRALKTYEKALGPEHPYTNQVRSNLAGLLLESGSAREAASMGQVALTAHDKILGQDHPETKNSATLTANALDALDRGEEAAALRKRYGIDGDKPK
jgi:Tfp pilus assembly protein PilF